MSARRKVLETRQALNDAVAESELQAAVVELAQLRGWLVHHCRPGATTAGRWATQIQGDPGFPDLVLARGRSDDHPPELLFVELKRQRTEVTIAQGLWIRVLSGVAVAASDLTVEVYLWRPSDWSSGEIERRLA
jgi:VRR-NUC domain